jgi:hypothetical protein
MNPIGIVSFPMLLLTMSPTVTSFAPARIARHFQQKKSSLAYSVHDEDKPILCYLISTSTTTTTTNNDDEQQQQPMIPQIVCTSNPEEYAWYYGIDEEQMVLTDCIHDAALQCVEGESPRGVPEWECESAFQ